MEFLSAEWCDALVSRAQRAAPTPALSDVEIEVQLVGAPRGHGRVTVIVEAGRIASCAAARSEDADLKLKMRFEDAAAMLRGEWDPNAAFMSGDLKTDGPTGPLLDLLSAWQRPGTQAARAELEELTVWSS